MADTVVKTVEDVDKLFSQIVVNGETYNSDRYVPPAPVQVIEEPEPEPQQTEISQNPSVPSGQTIQGEDVYAVVLNDEQHNFVDPEEVSSRTEADTTLQGNINSINALIPSDTTTSNKLVNESGIVSAVNTAVENAVADLDVPSVGGNGKYIKAISETNGKISATEGIMADTVESGNNDPVTSDAVNSAIAGMSGDVTQQIADAIGALDVASAGGSGKFIQSISETDGKINATEGTIDNVVTSGSTNPVTGGAVNTAIESAIASIYKPAGDKTVAQLTSALLVAGNLGNVYNITDSGTTTSDFVEGAGKPISAGDNVAIVDTGSQGSPSYKFDLLSGFIDLSNYIQKSQTSGLVKNDGTVDTTVYASQSSLSSYIQKSQTQGLVKNDGTIDTTAYAKQSEMSVTPGTGTDSDKTTIQLKTGTSATVLTQHIPAGSSTPVMDGTGSAGSSTDYARADHVHPSDTNKQDVLTFDSVPTENSTNPVTSGGIYTALQEKSSATDLPTDAVLHYSFDEVPDYPDGTAVYKHIKDFTSTSDWSVNPNRTVLSLDNNGLKAQSTGSEGYVQIWGTQTNVSSISNKIVKIKWHTNNANCTLYLVDLSSPYARHNISQKSLGNNFYEAIGYTESFSVQQSLFFLFNSVSADNYVVIDEIYIGDGSYSTPIIDNANGQWNGTNYGSIVTQGVSGKAIKSFQNSYKPIKNTNFKKAPPYTFSVWLKFSNALSQGQNIIDGRDGTIGSDEGIVVNQNLSIEVGSSGGQFVITQAGVIPINAWTNIVVVTTVEGNGNRYKVYVNGSLIKEEVTTVVNQGFKQLTVNGRVQDLQQGQAERELDDFLFFDRALSETEVQALYLNKANTPKYYDLADYQLNNGEVVKSVCSQLPDSSGNVALTKSDVGLGNVENTGDSAVPVQNGTTKFTTGGAFDFFGKSASAPSWLGKVFGRFMGRKWAYNANLNYDIASICYADGLWLVGTTSHGLWWSEDGKNWTQITTATNDSSFSSRTIKCIYYENGLYLAGASSGDNVYWSEDGKTWTRGTMTNPNNVQITGLVYANNLWLASSSDTTNGGLWWSEDGKNWTKITGVTESTAIYRPVYANGVWVTGGSKGLYKSSDGKNWTQILGDTTNFKIVFTPIFVDSAPGATNGLWVAGSETDKLLWSTDLETWTPTASAIASYVYTPVYVNGLWVAGSSVKLYWSYNGKTWEASTGANSAQCVSPVYNNGLWITNNTTGILCSEDGKDWISTNNIYSLRKVPPVYAKGIWLLGGASGLWYSDIEMALEDLTD